MPRRELPVFFQHQFRYETGIGTILNDSQTTPAPLRRRNGLITLVSIGVPRWALGLIIGNFEALHEAPEINRLHVS
jgi:hypothetical protein